MLPDIFLLILLSDGHVSAIGFQLMLKNPPKSIVLNTECVIQHGSDVILTAKEDRDTCLLDLWHHPVQQKGTERALWTGVRQGQSAGAERAGRHSSSSRVLSHAQEGARLLNHSAIL